MGAVNNINYHLDATIKILFIFESAQHVSGNLLPIFRSVRLWLQRCGVLSNVVVGWRSGVRRRRLCVPCEGSCLWLQQWGVLFNVVVGWSSGVRRRRLCVPCEGSCLWLQQCGVLSNVVVGWRSGVRQRRLCVRCEECFLWSQQYCLML